MKIVRFTSVVDNAPVLVNVGLVVMVRTQNYPDVNSNDSTPVPRTVIVFNSVGYAGQLLEWQVNESLDEAFKILNEL